MRKNIIVLLAAVLLVVIAGYVSNRYAAGGTSAASGLRPGSAAEDAAVRNPAPAFTLPDLSGEPTALADYTGKVVYLNFWTTWCKWCKKELPDLQHVYEDNRDQGLVVLAVDVGEDAGKSSSYIREKGYTFPVLLDNQKKVSEAYHVGSIPVSVLIDPQGRIAYQRVGAMNESEMRSVLAALLP